MEQNSVATIALISWPIISLLLYITRPAAQATIFTVLGAYLLLPVGAAIKFSMLPPLDKTTLPAMCTLVGCMIKSKHFRLVRNVGIVELFIVVYLACPIVTSLLNTDPVQFGMVYLPGVGLYDGISALESAFLFVLPFLIGREVLRTPTDTAELLRALVFGGLVYSLPLLFEIRFSPQLHLWLYGFSPSQFSQSMREGGFRPFVFTGHGLIAAFFVMTTVVASVALYRTRSSAGARSLFGKAVVWLAILMLLCKSLGALIYTATLSPLVWLTRVKLQVRVAILLTSLALLYPALRFAGYFPTEMLVQAASVVSDERSQSLEFRFNNEDQLLARASERAFFGWGRYGRSRIYNDETGEDLSTTDGRWIIVLGQFGLVGFFAEFGLLALGVFRSSRIVLAAPSDQIHLAALTLLVAINIVDLLPNSAISPWTLLVSGALVGRLEALKRLAGAPGRLGDQPN